MSASIHIISDNRPLATYLGSCVEKVFSGSVLPVRAGNLKPTKNASFVFVDHRLLTYRDSHANWTIAELHELYPNAKVIVFGAEEPEQNQYHVIRGARDFISGSMLSSGILQQYLATRMERDWLSKSA